MAKKGRPKKPEVLEVKPTFTPHIYQQEFIDNWKRFNVAITCRGWGKTALAVMALHTAALNSKNALTFAYIAPVKAQAWDVIQDIVTNFIEPIAQVRTSSGRPVDLVNIKASRMEIHYPTTGCTIKCYGADYPNNKVIRGKTFGGVVVDEFDDTDYGVWLEIISPCLRMHKGWALMVGTIKPGSNLYRTHDEFKDDPQYQCKVYKFEDCWEALPAYDEDEYELIRKRFANDPQKYAREYQCDPSASDDDVVISTPAIYAAKGKHLPESAYSETAKVLGVDVATGSGSDKSSICRRQGLACFPLEEYNVDNMALADIVARHITDWGPDAVFIDKGRGEGVISRLRQLGYKVIGVDFGGSAARKDLYVNKRTEMYCAIDEWLAMGGALPNDDELCQELATPVLKPTASEKKMMEQKHKIKERLNRSPDKGDSLALTFAIPVRRNMDRLAGHRTARTRASTGYNPLARSTPYHGLRR